MKTALVVTMYKQVKYWPRIAEAIKRQTRLPDLVVISIDRPQDDSSPEPNISVIDFIKKVSDSFELPYHILVPDIPSVIPRKNSDDTIFLAGHARNIGCEYAISNGHECIVFIDGDCVPQAKLIESHGNMCDTNEPILAVGRRREEKYRWQDQREVQPNMVSLSLFGNAGALISNPKLLEDCLIVWSCNISLNISAINRIKKLNQKYYQRAELFNSNFIGAWGGEDSFLGVQAWICRIFITTVPNQRAGIQHIDHPRPSTIYSVDHKSVFQDELTKLKTKMRLAPLTIDFFIA